MKLTEWFPHYVKPVRKGVYEVEEFITHHRWCYWNGSKWAWAETTPKNAVRFTQTSGAKQSKRWRGLASNPKKAPK